MANEDNIRNALLNQMPSPSSSDGAEKILARDTARVRRMKWITIIAWSIVGACFVAGSVLIAMAGSGDAHEALGVAGPALLSFAQMMAPFALIFTISLYVRSRTLTIRQIQMRLAAIENLLRDMAQNKSTA